MFKSAINKLLNYLVYKKNQKQYKSVKVVLENKHVEHLITVPNRLALLRLLPQNAVVAELGVDKGDFSEKILELTRPFKLHLVDVWDSKRYHGGLGLAVSEKFAKEIQQGRVEINRGLSTQVLKTFPDKYFDWIYIDTDHSYYTTAEELRLAKAKMKSGGIIAGHDYVIGYWDNSVRYGVIEAVHEFCFQNNWEIIFLTAETDSHLSFAIREIKAEM